MNQRQILFRDLGTIGYAAAWDYQEQLCRQTTNQKIANRKAAPTAPQQATQNYLLFCEHLPVYTLGRSGHDVHLLLDEQGLQQQGIEFYKVNRGGDITFHGPGQIVGYPILDLDHFFTDIHRYMRTLEEVIIRTLADYDLLAGRLAGATGVWLDADKAHKARKICAMGIRCTHWTTMHGWALNVNTDLQYFSHIIPCGIADKGVTSMHRELKTPYLDPAAVKERLKYHFAQLFEAEILASSDESSDNSKL